MSGPYRFQQESARSPLDRQQQNLFPAGQAPNFKTNVNRMKTKKWVEAKKNAYDGDDWGDYDEFDEYGADAAPPPPPPVPTGFRQPGQSLEQPSRSFTDPQQKPLPRPGRRNSFEAGEEQRAFSATYPQPAYDQAPTRPYHVDGPPEEARQAGNRQASGAESHASDTPQHRRDFSASALPPPLVTRISNDGPASTSPTNTSKPLPFIRPADIYKRAEEQRQSLDNDRPQQPPPSVPGLDSDFWSSGPQLGSLTGQSQVQSPPTDPGFRAAVDQAFTRTDDNRSVPPTPVSKQSDALVSRSNTESTSGISPIMSRVPSSATAALKQRNAAEGSTPVIAEESGDSYMSVSQSTPAAVRNDQHQAPLDASHIHARNLSASSLPRTGRATPSSVDSPGRSPVIEPQRFVAEPESAVIGSASPISHAMVAGNYAEREVDIALAMKKSPDNVASGLGAAERDTQAAFLESHQSTQSLPDDGAPRSRSESPSKGRVQELAERFGDISQSRRGSTQSNLSKHSVQSWERSRENSRPSSPTKPESNSRPTTARESSFRPKLPGTWESYATTAPTPSEKGERDLQVASPGPVQSPLGDVDLTPTTAKHPLAANDPEKPVDLLATLKAAGAAMGDAIQASIGTSDEAEHTKDKHRLPVGDIYVGDRPVHLERVASSVASSIPPTPPAKDTPRYEMPPQPPLKETSPEPASPDQELTPVRPAMVAQLSTEPYEDDEESDRLRKEIVASLTPSKGSSGSELNRASLQPTAPDAANRESSILDSYWDDREEVSPRPLQVQPAAQQQPPVTGHPDPNAALLTRFSWEQSSLQQPSNEGQAVAGASAGSAPATGNAPIPAATTTQQDTGRAAAPPSSQFPEPYFGPVHSVATEPVSSPDYAVRSPTPPQVAVEQPGSPVEPARPNESSPASGLHVVNSALDPEPVDIPPRLSIEGAASKDPPQYNQAESLVSGHKQDDSKVTEPQLPQPAVPAPSAAPESTPKSPSTDKPLGFRDIANIKSHSERIVSYNQTRDYWANADHGLSDWIASAVAANPELASQTAQAPIPQVARTGTARHRPAASLSLFGRHHGSKDNQALSNDQSGGPPSAANALPEARPSSSNIGSQLGRSASHQMQTKVQTKSKDLLHTAGVLSGKGMTGAKGLFAKGKSRFRSGDKVDK